jgi:hypothetical protein
MKYLQRLRVLVVDDRGLVGAEAADTLAAAAAAARGVGVQVRRAAEIAIVVVPAATTAAAATATTTTTVIASLYASLRPPRRRWALRGAIDDIVVVHDRLEVRAAILAALRLDRDRAGARTGLVALLLDRGAARGARTSRPLRRSAGRRRLDVVPREEHRLVT